MRWDLGKGRKKSSGDTYDIINWMGIVLPEFQSLKPKFQKGILPMNWFFILIIFEC